jgi:hypothetical protein
MALPEELDHDKLAEVAPPIRLLEQYTVQVMFVLYIEHMRVGL